MRLQGVASRKFKRVSWLLLLSGFALLAAATGALAQARNSCLECHSQLDDPLRINAAQFNASIHAQKGLGCTSCHGGDASSDDMDQAMGRVAGFRGHIERAQIPALCAKCHADAAYMRGFNPSVRTDQFSQYQTSMHGKLLARGDTHVAVCTDCHTTHNIQPPNDPKSSVYPLNVATTCARCHANAEYMKAYKIPTNQFAQYSASVHHAALTVGGDLSAPTCATCHGSHGAAPPGVTSVERVCATCHVFQQQLFDSGPHKDAFAAMTLPGCVTCHGNHSILHPTDSMIGTGTAAVCVKCHSSGEPAYAAAAKMHEELTVLSAAIDRSREILDRAETAGVEVGEGQLELSGAQDDLTKARVSIHSVEPAKVDEDIQAGMKVTVKTYQAGLAAMAELRYRRAGLAVSLIAIALVLLALGLLIRKLEMPKQG
jgi:Cytochrome c3